MNPIIYRIAAPLRLHGVAGRMDMVDRPACLISIGRINPIQSFIPMLRRPMKQLHLALVFALFLFLWPLGIGATSAAPHETLSGELILKLRPNAALDATAQARGPHAAALNALLHGAGAGAAVSLGPNSNTYRVRLRADADLRALARQLMASPDVVYA